jgi:hypothetical protein
MHMVNSGAQSLSERNRRARPRDVGPEAGNHREPARAQQFGGFGNGYLERDGPAVDPRAIHAGFSIAWRIWSVGITNRT